MELLEQRTDINMKIKLLATFIFTIILTCGCRPSLQVMSPHKNPIIIENKGKKCDVSGEFKTWFAFYGTLPIYYPDEKKMFGDPKYSYRLSQDYTMLDKVVSIFLGFMTSITRNTIRVEKCGKSIITVSKKVYKKMKADSQKKDISEVRNQRVLIFLKDGKQVQGKITHKNIYQGRTSYKILDSNSRQTVHYKKSEIEKIYFDLTDDIDEVIK